MNQPCGKRTSAVHLQTADKNRKDEVPAKRKQEFFKKTMVRETTSKITCCLPTT
tara:strand:+ start:239 stop:400 length:162 start_codon:yes stop_codon:yes gene_type:complete